MVSFKGHGGDEDRVQSRLGRQRPGAAMRGFRGGSGEVLCGDDQTSRQTGSFSQQILIQCLLCAGY